MSEARFSSWETPETLALPVFAQSVDRLDCRLEEGVWRFAETHRREIDAYWAELSCSSPHVWNGKALLARTMVVADGVLRSRHIVVNYADFLYWRHVGWPDKTVFNIFAMVALRGSDGPFVLGVMGAHTANPGKIYFPAGTPDLSDVTADGTVDYEASARRELAEETGLDPSALAFEPGWTLCGVGQRVALLKAVRAQQPAAALRDFILGDLQRQKGTSEGAELADVLIAADPSAIDSVRMPPFVTHYLRAALSTGSGRPSC